MAKKQIHTESTPDTVVAARRKRPRRFSRALMLLWVAVLLVFIYVTVQVVIVLTPSIKTELALLDSMNDAITVQGFVALESETVENQQGVLYYTVASGERVSQGMQVAEVYSNEASAVARGKLDEIDDEILLVENAQRAGTYTGNTEAYATQVNKSLNSMLDVLDSADYSGLHSAGGDVALAFNKLLMATGESAGLDNLLLDLQNQRASYAQQANATGSIAATQSGYFVIASGNDRVLMDYDTLANATPQSLLQKMDEPPQYYASNVAGYIISDYKWHFFALVSVEQAQRFTVGDKSLHLEFSETGGSSLPVRVESIETDEEAGIAKVELYCEYMSPEILKMQSQTVDIVFATYTGLRINKDALRIGEKVDENGVTTYPQGVYVEILGTVYFKEIVILAEDDYYMLVAPQSRNANSNVSQYDKVVVDSGGAELYDGRTL